ncbi:MAG: proline dehydrogenase family protein [Saprospiraceae bacterium]|nr:proline dehydrogenase family protein [Saprospiraceae bacterium]
MSEPEQEPLPDFSDTEIAFSNKSDKELKQTAWLFRLMNNPGLVKFGSVIGYHAVKLRIPLTDFIVRKTIFKQFCGGENLLDCQKTIDHLYEFDTLTVLDYGAEGKTDEDELDAVMQETMRAIEMAASNNSVPNVSTKITGLADKNLLLKIQEGQNLSSGEQRQYNHLVERIDEICSKAAELEVGLYVDAEESWIQDPIDRLVMSMMEKYNKEKVIIYNTYQLYISDKLDKLKADHQSALAAGVLFGAKLVRGAYMDKERRRAKELGYPSPIQPDKAATDKDYNLAIKYCLENHETIASCCASHNAESNLYQAELINKLELDHNHPHIYFCQLYGMSDNITFNLAHAGYNVAKYVVYGPIKDVIPYLIRRTEENSSVTGEMSRELALIDTEMRRRGLQKK